MTCNCGKCRGEGPYEGIEPEGYNCHKCGEWYREEEMHRVDRVFDTVYYCSDCWDDDAEVECWCGLLHHISEPCDHDGQGVYGGPDVV
jgi:hypothetical protein